MPRLHHYVLPGSTLSTTRGMYRRLRSATRLHKREKIVRQATLDSFEHLQTLPVRPNALLEILDQVSNSAASSWVELSKELSKETDNFTAQLIQQQFKPFNVSDSYRRAVREILWHAHAIHLSLESLESLKLSSLPRLNSNSKETEKISLRYAVEEILSSAKAFSVEKYGVSPPLTLICAYDGDGGEDDDDDDDDGEKKMMIGKDVPVNVELQEVIYLEYVLVELLKNAYGAQIDKYGALDVEDAEPLELCVKMDVVRGFTGLTLVDYGTGMDQVELEQCCEPLHTTVVEEQDDPWRYSRTFGARFAGAGLGIFKSQIWSDFLGASDFQIYTTSGVGTKIAVAGAMVDRQVLEKLTVPLLKLELKARGLPMSGKKAALIDTLLMN